MNKHTTILCILDGFGLTPKYDNNAFAQANTPHLDKMFQTYPWILGYADGEAVGLEDGLVGNSEVGHMNIGGLKLVPQLSYQITKSAENVFAPDDTIAPDQLLDPKENLSQRFANHSKRIHITGLFSQGTVHADLRHWFGAIQAASQAGAEQIILHLISDGRDVDRQSLASDWQFFVNTYLSKVEDLESKITLGSLGGRYFAMDRANNWDRTQQGLDAMMYAADVDELVTGYDVIYEELKEVTEANYQLEAFDETHEPVSFGESILAGDTVWIVNFRTDRVKQFSQLLCDMNDELDLNLHILTMNDYGNGLAIVDYNADAKGYYPVFMSKPVQGTLSEAIEAKGLTQLHIAETEKYNHVTYFLNGGQNKKTVGEDWHVIDSHKLLVMLKNLKCVHLK
jgi:2,3-bisphosphoglycerate-independent phosphoglycerate mutase